MSIKQNFKKLINNEKTQKKTLEDLAKVMPILTEREMNECVGARCMQSEFLLLPYEFRKDVAQAWLNNTKQYSKSYIAAMTNVLTTDIKTENQNV